MSRLGYFLIFDVMLLVMIAQIAAQEKPGGPPFSSGEAIIKFSAKSKAAELYARASAQGSQADTDLTSYIKSVSTEVGIPFAVKQFGSGGSLIVAIRQSDLLAVLMKRLGENPNVKDSHLAADQNPPAIEVEFKDNTPEAELLAEAIKEGTESGGELQALAGKLEADCHLAVTARVIPSHRLLLSPDLQKLTLDLTARLSKRPDVEYAQPNFLRGPIGAAQHLLGCL